MGTESFGKGSTEIMPLGNGEGLKLTALYYEWPLDSGKASSRMSRWYVAA